MKRIAVIGDSHTAALKNGWRRMAPGGPDVAETQTDSADLDRYHCNADYGEIIVRAILARADILQTWTGGPVHDQFVSHDGR